MRLWKIVANEDIQLRKRCQRVSVSYLRVPTSDLMWHFLDSDHTDPSASEASDLSIKVNGIQKRIRNFSGTEESKCLPWSVPFKLIVTLFTDHKSLINNENTTDNIEQERVEDESGISQLFGTKQDCVHRCLKCNEENTKSTIQMVCNLLYAPSKAGKDPSLTNGSEPSTFKKVLESSLCFDKTTPAWCETCKKFTPTNQKSKVRLLIFVLIHKRLLFHY